MSYRIGFFSKSKKKKKGKHMGEKDTKNPKNVRKKKKEKATKTIKSRSRFLPATITLENFSRKMQFYECVNKVPTHTSEPINRLQIIKLK